MEYNRLYEDDERKNIEEKDLNDIENKEEKKIKIWKKKKK